MKKTILFALLFSASALFAQPKDAKPADEWKIFGESQIRTELDGRDFSNLTHPYSFTHMRTRVGVEKQFGSRIFMKATLQDTRLWGKETSTTADMHNLDLHEGYVRFSDFLEIPISVQAGRFEMNYGTSRFISSVQWFWNARAFDGFKIRYQDKSFWADLFGTTIGSKNSYTYISSLDATNSVNNWPDSSQFLYGLWTNTKFNADHNADMFLYYERNSITVNNDGDKALNRYTVGATYWGNLTNEMKIVAEGAYQFGNAGALDISAYTGGLKFKYDTKPIGFEAAVDMLSGTKPEDYADGKWHNFERPYASSLAFYGRMSYLTTSNQGVYGNCGIIDPNLKINFESEKKEIQAYLHYHYLMAANSLEIEGSDKSGIGNEIDFDLVYNVTKGASFQIGGGVFLPGDIMKARWSNDAFKREDMGFWVYLGTNVKL